MVDEADPLEKLEAKVQKLEGRVRGIEALLLEMPEVTKKQVDAAKERVRENVRRRNKLMADLKEKMGAPLDEDAEAALDEVAYMLKKRE